VPEPEKAAVRKFLKAYDELDWDTWKALAHPGHTFHFPLAPAPLDRDGHLGFAQTFRQSFSKMEHIIEDFVTAGNMVAVRGCVRITHDGEFQGIAPTGKILDVTFMDFVRVEDGQIAEEWVELNAAKMMADLGAG